MSGAEVVDIVDEDDRFLRRGTRAEVRTGRLWHRATYIVVLGDGGTVFVHLRTSTKDVYASHYDVVVGGVVGAGEGYAAAAEREVLEELGVAPIGLTEAGALRFDDGSNRVHGRVFECRCAERLVLQPEEIVSGQWVDVATVEALFVERQFCPDGIRAFRVWQDHRQLA